MNKRFLLQMDDIKSFRQWGSQTPGHPENFITKGVEVTTGASTFFTWRKSARIDHQSGCMHYTRHVRGAPPQGPWAPVSAMPSVLQSPRLTWLLASTSPMPPSSSTTTRKRTRSLCTRLRDSKWHMVTPNLLPLVDPPRNICAPTQLLHPG